MLNKIIKAKVIKTAQQLNLNSNAVVSAFIHINWQGKFEVGIIIISILQIKKLRKITCPRSFMSKWWSQDLNLEHMFPSSPVHPTVPKDLGKRGC